MNIVRHGRLSAEDSTLEEFADRHRLSMDVWQRGDGSFFCWLHGAEIKNGGFLTSESGNGDTELEAFRDYAKRISGKLLVIDAYQPTRREIYVPLLRLSQPETE